MAAKKYGCVTNISQIDKGLTIDKEPDLFPGYWYLPAKSAVPLLCIREGNDSWWFWKLTGGIARWPAKAVMEQFGPMTTLYMDKLGLKGDDRKATPSTPD